MSAKGAKRLESVRVVVDEMLLRMTDAEERRNGYIHLYGVSEYAALLAQKRGLDPEVAAIAGMLHDFYSYKTSIYEFHGQNGAEAVRPKMMQLKKVCTLRYPHRKILPTLNGSLRRWVQCTTGREKSTQVPPGSTSLHSGFFCRCTRMDWHTERKCRLTGVQAAKQV